MPNVFNYLRIQAGPEVYSAAFAAIADDHAGPGSIDFNKITPMPAWVYRGELDSATLAARGKENCWRDWSLQNWGSEWNAMEPEACASAYDGGPGIYFITKSGDVRMLVDHLSRMYPEVYFDYLWANQDIDKGAGALQYLDGVLTFSYLPEPGTKAAYDLAFDVLHANPAEYGMALDPMSGNYVWKGGERHGRRAH